MPYCSNCGTEIKEDAKFCTSCGKAVEEKKEETAGEKNTQQSNTYTAPAGNDFSAKVNEFTNTEDKTAEFEPTDISDNKVYSILAYIGILVLVPILAAPKSKFARFHANQGLVLFIIEAAYGIISSVIANVFKLVFGFLPGIFSVTYILISAVLSCIGLVFLVFVIIGIINAANGKAKELPIIGKIKLLK